MSRASNQIELQAKEQHRRRKGLAVRVQSGETFEVEHGANCSRPSALSLAGRLEPQESNSTV